MKTQILKLFFFSSAMFSGSYLFGIIPLFFSFSQSKINLFSSLGAGLLLGVALSVILPEGVQTLLLTNMLQTSHLAANQTTPLNTSSPSTTTSSASSTPLSHSHLALLHSLTSSIGVALLTGFLFMLFMDQIQHINPPKQKNHAVEARKNSAHFMERSHSVGGTTATLGLILHSAADGIAVGSAFSTAKSDLEMLVFVAIMLHKAPSAFGLSTFLLHEGFDNRTIRRNLFLFSLAA
eukprot:Sdes_comp20250_c0_seq1m13685